MRLLYAAVTAPIYALGFGAACVIAMLIAIVSGRWPWWCDVPAIARNRRALQEIAELDGERHSYKAARIAREALGGVDRTAYLEPRL